MSAFHPVYCKKCGRELVRDTPWGGPIVREDVYECQGEFRQRVDFVGSKRIKTITVLCASQYQTQYCKGCTVSLRGCCGRPRCKGVLRLVRRKNGCMTKCRPASEKTAPWR